jgi:predicted DCC family thiol-disulfide oxidoreductase YuxK
MANRFFRDFVYDNVANNRYSILGRRDQCRVSDARFDDRFVV